MYRDERPAIEACPRCRGPVRRAHRHAADHLLKVFYPVKRYRCRDKQCGWVGLLHTRRARRPGGRGSRFLGTPLWLWALALAAALVLGFVLVGFIDSGSVSGPTLSARQ
jgi:hypothetical protein